MFDNLRRAFKEAVDNFNRELNRDQVPDTVDRLLREMKQEAAGTRARITALEEQIAETKRAVATEEQEVRTCLRREAMARQIGDEETAKVAGDFARKHERRRTVLAGKAEALEEELQLRQGEFDEMLDRIREAGEQRDSLAASAGRTQAHETLGGANDLFDELDRMAEKVGDADAEGSAWSELDDIGGDYRPEHGIDLEEPGPSSRRPTEEQLDAALEELKRRMGDDG